MTPTLADWRELVLDPQSAPHRRILVEASAGTGKTWTISVLYLRLVVEHGLRPEAIAVSTFTDAAAAELRERIRTRLQWALRRCTGACAPADDEADVEHWLAATIAQVSGAEVAWRLQRALAELDRAAIGTLHAVCRRILTEQALAAGSALRIGELVSGNEVRDELLDDLTRWLAHATFDDEASGLPALRRMSPEARAKRVKAAMAPGLTIVGGEVEPLFALFADATWPTRLREFAAVLAMNGKKRALRTRLVELADWLAMRDVAAEIGDKREDQLDDLVSIDFWHDQIAAAHVEATLADPVARFARDAAALLRERDDILCAQGVRRILPMLAGWRETRLAEREQFTFDDLIERVHAQATAPRGHGEHLSDRLHAQWPITLIDEFQDTDARQWGIFDAIHRAADGTPRGLLLLIGDPKQAIYGFRGGDIATYLRAAATTTQCLALTVNQRASRALVAATNALYGASDAPFAMDDDAIHYVPVQAAGRTDGKPLRRTDGTNTAALHLHAHVGDALDLCVAQIADYLAPDRWCLGNEPLKPGDIAVLLPKHANIVELRDRLARRRIPCVSGGRSDLFASIWANELRVVLHALADPADAAVLRAALATRLLGNDYADLHQHTGDEARWREQVDRIVQWSEGWHRHGVLHVVDRIVACSAPRLLARIDGERALTDLRHLGECLQAEAQRHPGRHQLLSWFATQCEQPEGGDDASAKARELRIESDAGRVQLLTLHASKGLEFPVVLLPLMDAQRGRRPDFPVWTDSSQDARCIDLGHPDIDQHRALAAREGLQERARLLYVALTRARHACHLLLPGDGAAVGDEGSAWAWLLRDLDLAALAARCPDIAMVREAPAPAARMHVAQATLPRRARSWPSRRPLDAAYSFSSLMARAAPAWHEDDAARDELATSDDLDIASTDHAHPALAALSEWRGSEFGNVLHGVFEHREIGRPMRAQRALALAQLARSGLRVDAARHAALVDALLDRVQATLDADLGGGLRLGEVDARAQRAEMAFQFRLDRLDLPRLRSLCAQSGESGLVPDGLGTPTLRGFLSGKIDLLIVHGGVVHVLDYKSNHLGDTLSDYQGAALDRAMDAHAYRWQALLYAVAVRRYLARRQRGHAQALPLGDVIYLFVRAIGLAPEAGVWRRRFAPDFLAAVDALFATADAGAA